MFCDFQVYTAKTQSPSASWPISLSGLGKSWGVSCFAKPLLAQNITNIRNFPLKSTTYAIPADRTFKNI